ncbi:hypothetical protein, partial [Streptococcus pneumoniae]|uniref:hypothetical protein n=1 Tax=Streptococcus pneumoniae TaxID=1313 RepID=UPI0012D70FB1
MLARWGAAFAAGPAKEEDQDALISGSFEDLWGYDTSSRFRRLGQSVGLVRVVQKKGGISTPSTCTAT